MDKDSVNDIVVLGLDQVLPMERAQSDLLNRIDRVIARSVEENDPDIAGDAISYLLGMSRVSGLSLAKLIYTFKINWTSFKRKDSCESYLNEHVGISKVTSKRYNTVWEMLVSEDIPRDYAERIKLLPIRCIVPIATMWSQGWEVSSAQWSQLANAPDPSSVSKIIREIKNTEPKKNSLQIELDVDGTLYAWKNSIRYFVGTLNISDFEPVVQEAISRLTADGRVTEKE